MCRWCSNALLCIHTRAGHFCRSQHIIVTSDKLGFSCGPGGDRLRNLWNSGLCLFVCFFGCFILILFSFLFASPMWVFSVQVVNEVLGQELNRKLDRVSKHVNFTETVPRCTCQRGIGDVRVTVHMAPSCDVRVTVHGAPKL